MLDWLDEAWRREETPEDWEEELVARSRFGRFNSRPVPSMSRMKLGSSGRMS